MQRRQTQWRIAGSAGLAGDARSRHKLVDDMMANLETVRERPVWRPITGEIREKLHGPAPLNPQGAEQAYADFVEQVLPYPLGNTHPRFWGWVIGNGNAGGDVCRNARSRDERDRVRRTIGARACRRTNSQLVQRNAWISGRCQRTSCFRRHRGQPGRTHRGQKHQSGRRCDRAGS